MVCKKDGFKTLKSWLHPRNISEVKIPDYKWDTMRDAEDYIFEGLLYSITKDPTNFIINVGEKGLDNIYKLKMAFGKKTYANVKIPASKMDGKVKNLKISKKNQEKDFINLVYFELEEN